MHVCIAAGSVGHVPCVWLMMYVHARQEVVNLSLPQPIHLQDDSQSLPMPSEQSRSNSLPSEEIGGAPASPMAARDVLHRGSVNLAAAWVLGLGPWD